MRDKVLICIQCDNPFTLSSEEQERLLRREFGLPKRCPDCRRKKSKRLLTGKETWRRKREKRNDREKGRHWEDGT